MVQDIHSPRPIAERSHNESPDRFSDEYCFFFAVDCILFKARKNYTVKH